MSSSLLFLVLLVYSSILADFVLQPDKWAKSKWNHGWKSKYLYLHVFVVASLAGSVTLFFFGLSTAAAVSAIIFVTHLIIDAITARSNATASSLIADQRAHFAVILTIWILLFNPDFSYLRDYLTYPILMYIFVLLMGYTIVLHPTGIFISRITQRWRESICVNASDDATGLDDESLEDAGKYIGYLERFLILTFILLQQYTAIGFLIAAKSVFRFNATRKTSEYILIGTLLSFSIAILVGFIVSFFLSISLPDNLTNIIQIISFPD